MRAPWRQSFDRDREFVARRMFTFNGYTFEAGQTFDASLASTRRLKQLFDRRILVYAHEPPPGSIIPAEDLVEDQQAPEPDFPAMAKALLGEAKGLSAASLRQKAVAILGEDCPEHKMSIMAALRKVARDAV